MANEDQSRWFLVLRVQSRGTDSLSSLLAASNHVAARFGQPTLYTTTDPQILSEPGAGPIGEDKEPLSSRGHHAARRNGADDVHPASAGGASGFHVSIGWSLKSPTGQFREALSDFPSLKPLTIVVSKVKVKIGNAVHIIEFEKAHSSPGGIIA